MRRRLSGERFGVAVVEGEDKENEGDEVEELKKFDQ